MTLTAAAHGSETSAWRLGLLSDDALWGDRPPRDVQEVSADAPDALVRTLDLLCPDAPVALSALHSTDRMENAFFDYHADGAAWVRQLPSTAKAVYVVMNPYTKTSAGRGITKTDITRLRWLLIDCDPKREKRSNATAWEAGLARDVAAKIQAYLTSRGWPAPLTADSGNGAHLVYAIDLPNDAAATKLINEILNHLAKFNTPGVEVDQSTGDACQITKLYGTMTRKGPATAERPHRPSALTSIPTTLDIVPLSLLQTVVGAAPKAAKQPKRSKSRGDLHHLDEILAKLTVFSETDRGDYTEYQVQCPWHQEHSDPDSQHGTIFTWTNGAPGFTCPHSHCADRHWEAFRDRLGIVAHEKELEEFCSYFITQLGAKEGGRLITMIGHDATFPPSFQTYSAFREYYCDTVVNVGSDARPKWTTRAKQWLQNARHRKYVDVQFLPPPLPVPTGVLNLWNGFAVQPDPLPYPEQRCVRFLQHVRDVICGGEEPDVAEFHLDVLAAKVQEPAELTEVAVVYRGPQGAGKNATVDYLEKIFGRHFATVDKQQLVTGRFNAVLSSKLVLVLDEAMWPGYREFTGALKSLITSRTLQVERKGIDPISEANFVQAFVLTNNDWAWPAELGDRRALILNVLPTHKGDVTYFKEYYDEMHHGGAEALLAFLQQREITHELRRVPHTKARDYQVALTDDDPVRSMWFEMLHRGLTWPESEEWEEFISTKDLEEYYVERCRATRQKSLPAKMLLQRWHEMLPPTSGHPKQRRIIDRELIVGARKRGGWPRDKEGVEHLPDPTMRRGTMMPSIEICREHYAKNVVGQDINWPEPAKPEPASMVNVTCDTADSLL